MNGTSIIKALTLGMWFMDSRTSIPRFGIVTSPLRITASEKMVLGVYALPIAANMSFPSLSYVGIMIGGDNITQEDLVISKLLGQNIEKYRSLFLHVCAAIQSATNEDSFPSKGDNIKYIYTDAQHSNPLCRVTPVKDVEKENLRYDKEKYREMILDAAQARIAILKILQK